MTREKSAPLAFYLSSARGHIEKWRNRGCKPLVDGNSSYAWALCSIAMAYDLDRSSFEGYEREYFTSNVGRTRKCWASSWTLA